MGCDIHGFIEYRSKDDKRDEPIWNAVSEELSLGRNYNVFGYLTDGQVRYNPELEFGVRPKGLPKGNLSFEVREANGDDEYNHSHSWLSLNEYEMLIEEMLKSEDEDVFVGTDYHLVLDIMKSLDNRGMVPRFVFWFDS
jgi:hypothetical protein